jgi:hypothetical protein
VPTNSNRCLVFDFVSFQFESVDFGIIATASNSLWKRAFFCHASVWGVLPFWIDSLGIIAYLLAFLRLVPGSVKAYNGRLYEASALSNTAVSNRAPSTLTDGRIDLLNFTTTSSIFMNEQHWAINTVLLYQTEHRAPWWLGWKDRFDEMYTIFEII